MMNRHIVPVDASAQTAVGTVMTNANGAVVGVVFDSSYRTLYEIGETMDVVAAGPCLLRATVKTGAEWTDGVAVVGDRLSLSGSDIRVNDNTATRDAYIGKVAGISNTNVYEVLVGI
ncbi:hypothetical protein HNP93_001000 [Methanococcus maripaludis]|uniref:DUF2190 family protein n=1 Tax=Methanococcus maripaludis TaxID=39152 RepID=A0A7J9PA82_METMI|nr:hypothetical protein [Methanococcus maripaludis]MBA2858299.1 hypothetical protein [Methanococcus maripaludis]